MLRLTLAFWIGIACAGFGAALRVGAENWSRDIITHGADSSAAIKPFDPKRYELYREVGAWSIGFGLVVLALSLNNWVSRESVKR